MTVIFGALSILMFLASIVWALKILSGVMRGTVDSAGRLKGNYKRKKFRNAAELSPIAAINDSAIAAATIIYACVIDGATPKDELKQILEYQLMQIVSSKQAEEAAIYADWACKKITNYNTILLHLAPLLRQNLNDEQKGQLIAIIYAVWEEMKVAEIISISPMKFQNNVDKLKKK